MVIYPKYEGAFPAGILGLIMSWNADKYQFTTMKQEDSVLIIDPYP